MSDWVLVPCLVTLRSEFNTIAPERDKGSDGSIGDSNHTSASDHTPDEDSDILRDHDADSKNEVHALDIDSSGPWPGGWAWFDAAVKAIVDRERARWLDPNDVCRLEYAIWNRQIASRSIGDFRWRPYTSTKDPHTNHAHFSARYLTVAESDTSPWGLVREVDTMSVKDVQDYFENIGRAVRGDAAATSQDRIDRQNFAAAVRFALGQNFSEQGSTLDAEVDALTAAVTGLPEAVLHELGNSSKTPAEIAAILRPVLGSSAGAVGRELQSTQP